MNSNMFITGGSGLLGLNWALFKRDQYNITLGLHDRKIVLAGVAGRQFPIDSVDKIIENFDAIKPQLVIHTAGLTNVEKCEENPNLARHINIELAENVAKVCKRLCIPLVHISTDHLFSGEMNFMNEEQPVNPRNMYARTKAEAESHVLNIYPETLVIRTNFYGWGPSYRSSFSDIVINTLKNGKSLTLFQDVFYTPIYTGILVQAVHELVKLTASGIYHVVGDERVSKYQFGKKIATQFNLDPSFIKMGSISEHVNLTQRPGDMSLSNKKVCKLLGKTLGGVDEHIKLLYQYYEEGLAQEIQNL